MFQILGHFKMKLNAANCTFGVSSGKFFGLMVNNRRIEANLEKIKAMQDLKPPTSLKELQILIGVVASLNRFIFKCSDRCRSFFKALKKTRAFVWNDECDKALADMKDYLSHPPLIFILKSHE